MGDTHSASTYKRDFGFGPQHTSLILRLSSQFVHVDHTDAVKSNSLCVCVCVCIMDLSLMPVVSPWTSRHLQYVKNAWQEWLFTTWVWATSCLCLWKRERELKNEWKSVMKKKSHQVEGG